MAAFVFGLFFFTAMLNAENILHGVYSIEDDIEFVFQLPKTRPQGVLFVAHGCSHSATDWWPKSASCPKCIGLPVETSIVRKGLDHNYAILAISSYNRSHKCWSIFDVSIVLQIIKSFYEKNFSSDFSIPLHLFGASSGGSFVGSLSQSRSLQPSVSSVCVQISTVRGKTNSPPTLFVLMAKDKHTYQAVEHRAQRITFNQILLCKEKPISASYFMEHSGAMERPTLGLSNINLFSSADSTAIHKALLKAGIIDPVTYLLKEDPRNTDWRPVSCV